MERKNLGIWEFSSQELSPFLGRAQGCEGRRKIKREIKSGENEKRGGNEKGGMERGKNKMRGKGKGEGKWKKGKIKRGGIKNRKN